MGEIGGGIKDSFICMHSAEGSIKGVIYGAEGRGLLGLYYTKPVALRPMHTGACSLYVKMI